MNEPKRQPQTTAPRSTPASADQAGFTLVELLIVVAIIGILSAMAVINLQSSMDKAKQRKTMANMHACSVAIESYSADLGYLPANGISADELRSALSNNLYKSVDTQDGWNRDMAYTTDGAHYTIESYGRDANDGPLDVDRTTRDDFDNDLLITDGVFSASPETAP
jgi:type II secretion system protein G